MPLRPEVMPGVCGNEAMRETDGPAIVVRQLRKAHEPPCGMFGDARCTVLLPPTLDYAWGAAGIAPSRDGKYRTGYPRPSPIAYVAKGMGSGLLKK